MRDYFRSAMDSLIANKLRSALTILGIVIGVWTITSMQAVMLGFEKTVQNVLSEFGTETFSLSRWPAVTLGDDWLKYRQRQRLNFEDALYIEKHARLLRGVSAEISENRRTISYERHKTGPGVLLTGASAAWMISAAASIQEGRFYTAEDVLHRRKVIVLGKDVNDILFVHESALGKTVRVGDQLLTVIGVLGPRQDMSGESPDNVVLMPITVHNMYFGNRWDDAWINCRAMSADLLPEAIDEVVALMRVRHKLAPREDNDFEVITGESILQTMSNLTMYVRLAAYAIAGISLLVAGIGIMNIMLVAVLERTKEIGTRKAVGARRSHIMWQFLFEAVILSQFAAIIGIALSFGTAWLISNNVPNISAVVDFRSITLAIANCTAIGLGFGIFPAMKAARLDPIDALRFE